MASGEKRPSMYGKGGMKALVQSKTRSVGPSEPFEVIIQ